MSLLKNAVLKAGTESQVHLSTQSSYIPDLKDLQEIKDKKQNEKSEVIPILWDMLIKADKAIEANKAHIECDCFSLVSFVSNLGLIFGSVCLGKFVSKL